MAAPTTSGMNDFLIKVGDGAVPEVFTNLCGLTSKGLNINNNTASTPVPDCADEEAPAYEEQAVTSQMVGIKGSGVYPRERQKFIADWALGGLAKNVRVYPGKAAVGDIEYFEGPAILKTLDLAISRGEKVQQSLDLVFAAKPTTAIKA